MKQDDKHPEAKGQVDVCAEGTAADARTVELQRGLQSACSGREGQVLNPRLTAALQVEDIVELGWTLVRQQML